MEVSDGQQSSHGEAYAYGSLYWAEFYDLWVQVIFGTVALEKDDDFFWSLVSPFLSTDAPNDGQLRIVDVGTGTGRVIRGILRKMGSPGPPETPLVNQRHIEIVGIDHSQAMIERAKDLMRRDAHSSISVEWHIMSATKLVTEIPTLRNATDLVIFAAGSIGYLTAEGERKEFLHQVVHALRRTDPTKTYRSIAAISILSDDERTDETDQQSENKLVDVKSPEWIQIRSQRWPQLGYRKSPAIRSRAKGQMYEQFTLEVSDIDTGAIIDRKEYSWSLSLFNHVDWANDVAECGLQIREKIERGAEIWYILCLTDTVLST